LRVGGGSRRAASPRSSASLAGGRRGFAVRGWFAVIARVRGGGAAPTQMGDHPAVVTPGRFEDGGPRYQNLGAGGHDRGGVVHFHAAVYLEQHRAAGAVDHGTRPLDLLQYAGDESLAAETRIDRHDQQEIYVRQNLLDAVQDRKSVV